MLSSLFRQEPGHFQIEGFRLEGELLEVLIKKVGSGTEGRDGGKVAGLKMPVADQRAPAVALDSQRNPRRQGEVVGFVVSAVAVEPTGASGVPVSVPKPTEPKFWC